MSKAYAPRPPQNHLIGAMAALPLLLCALLGCTGGAPVSDLSDGRAGKISFESDNASFKARFDKSSTVAAVTIKGRLFIPEAKGARIPAAVLLHGLGGVSDDIPRSHIENLAENLHDIGMATFIVDSQSPREARMMSEVFAKVTYAMRVADAFAALELLSTHPKIDPQRIGVVGISRGGNIALMAQSKTVRAHYLENPEIRFSAMLLLYPLCYLRPAEWDLIDVPMLMLLGERDNITPAATAMAIADQLKARQLDMAVTVFKDAYHAFDWDFFAGKKIEWFYDLSGCQDRYVVVQADGMLYSAHTGVRVEDARELSKEFSGCLHGPSGFLGGPETARAEAIETYTRFFTSAFKL